MHFLTIQYIQETTGLRDYTDIEGIEDVLHEQSLILARENDTNNSGQEEVEINENLINFELEMANQTLKLPLEEVAKLVPDFDPIPLDEYIEKLKQATRIISDNDEQNLVQILKIKLKGTIYKALANVEIANIETFIQTSNTTNSKIR